MNVSECKCVCVCVWIWSSKLTVRFGSLCYFTYFQFVVSVCVRSHNELIYGSQKCKCVYMHFHAEFACCFYSIHYTLRILLRFIIGLQCKVHVPVNVDELFHIHINLYRKRFLFGFCLLFWLHSVFRSGSFCQFQVWFSFEFRFRRLHWTVQINEQQVQAHTKYGSGSHFIPFSYITWTIFIVFLSAFIFFHASNRIYHISQISYIRWCDFNLFAFRIVDSFLYGFIFCTRTFSSKADLYWRAVLWGLVPVAIRKET